MSWYIIALILDGQVKLKIYGQAAVTTRRARRPTESSEANRT